MLGVGTVVCKAGALRVVVFFFNDTATTEIYTLSLHDALPISAFECHGGNKLGVRVGKAYSCRDRKSTRLNSSHRNISYAVFCLKKKWLTSALHRALHRKNLSIPDRDWVCISGD